jgi:parvulin-like peptidyl-prolyl isomerase
MIAPVRRRRLSVAALCVASLLAVLAPTTLRAADDVVARIGEFDLKSDDVRAFIAGLEPREQAALARDPALLSQAVRTLLARKVILKEVLAQKWDQTPAVAAQLQQARETTLVELYLRAMTRPPDGYPSDAELEGAYEANKTAFLVPRQFRLGQIVVAVAKDADKPAQDKARKKLDDMQKRLKQKGADFAAIAQSDSDDRESAKRQGEIGWLSEAQLTPEIRAQVVGLAKDGIADPLRLDDGWHLIKLLDTKPAHTPPLAELRDQLAERLRAERAQANRRAYLAKVVQENPPAVNELALSKLTAKPEN